TREIKLAALFTQTTRDAERTKWIMRDAHRLRPLAAALFQARAEHAGVNRVFAFAAVIDGVEIAVRERFDASGMFVRAGPDFRTEYLLDALLAGMNRRCRRLERQQSTEDDRKGLWPANQTLKQVRLSEVDSANDHDPLLRYCANRLLKKACFEKATLKIIGVFA
ncbi:MAG: hypothetical protein KJ070_22235, partial [Verrucomicrobia bacterium]|nr:hypothetical protein [Verrucomicrobiota bacterium]